MWGLNDSVLAPGQGLINSVHYVHTDIHADGILLDPNKLLGKGSLVWKRYSGLEVKDRIGNLLTCARGRVGTSCPMSPQTRCCHSIWTDTKVFTILPVIWSSVISERVNMQGLE